MQNQPAPAAPAAGGQQQQQGFSGMLGTIGRLIMMYYLFSYFFKSKPAVDPTTGVTLPPHTNLYKGGEHLDLYLYFSEYKVFNFEDQKSSLKWMEKDIYYDWKETNTREKFLSFPTPKNLIENGTLYAHVYFAKSGYPHNPQHADYDPHAVIYGVHQLNKYMPIKKESVKKNLISGEIENPDVLERINLTTERVIVSYWKPNMTLHLVDDQTAYPRGGIPPQFLDAMRFDNETGKYFPVIYFDDFWLLKENLVLINETVKELNLSLSYSPISMMMWQLKSQMEQSFSMQQSMGTAEEGDSDEFKRMLSDTNPWLLGLTGCVTLLHSVFDFLAFKNDVTFWKNKKTFEGMSVRTMMLNTVCQVIIFLYLLDNDTSWMIIISCGVGLAIEFWKLKKAVIFEVDWSKRFPIVMKDRESYASATKEHDIVAMRYLSYALYPLIFGYAVYSLLYQTHKSWYSWVLSTLTGCVYTFGFIMMCPQLYLNYKLKSVAHLPFRAFMYKALNTVIDDLFAFIIKMPLMHRLSCFRDDIIFLIYLYQRWIYPVDKKRVNEFGQGGEDEPAEQHPATMPATDATTATAQETEPLVAKTLEEKKKD